MKRIVLVPVAIVAAAVAWSPLAAAAPPTLVGTTGPGFTITLTKSGKAVKTLPHGAYKIVVRDKSAIHNFHLFGPGLNKVVTTVPFVGTKTITVTLKKGTYTFQCDVHARAGMKGTFKVT
jgi:hypothetical protein